jgi:hypothetical protein
MFESFKARRQVRRARLPWRDLEAEAARQGCSPADIFFDWAGRLAADGDEQIDPDVTLSSSEPARRAVN